MIAAALILMQMGMTGASTWVTQPVGTQADLHIVRAIDARVAWAAGEHGTFARTADGGITWFAKPIYTCTSCQITGLVAQDEQSASAVSASPARIYVTGDGGRSWALRWESDQHGARLAGLAFFDAHRGFAVSDSQDGRYNFLRTEDGGATWIDAPRDTLPAPLAGERIAATSGLGAVAVSASTAFIAVSDGKSSRVFRTEDGGKSWTASPARLSVITALAFASPREGLAVGSGRGRATVVRTTDGGKKWGEPLSAALPGIKEGVAFIPGTAGKSAVAVGASGTVLSTDGGLTWSVMDRLPARAIAFAGPVDAGWKVGDGGSVKKLLRGISTSRRAGEPVAPSSVVAPSLGRTEAKPEAHPGATPTPMGSRPLKKGTNLEN